jgi:hypothetical protein
MQWFKGLRIMCLSDADFQHTFWYRELLDWFDACKGQHKTIQKIDFSSSFLKAGSSREGESANSAVYFENVQVARLPSALLHNWEGAEAAKYVISQCPKLKQLRIDILGRRISDFGKFNSMVDWIRAFCSNMKLLTSSISEVQFIFCYQDSFMFDHVYNDDSSKWLGTVTTARELCNLISPYDVLEEARKVLKSFNKTLHFAGLPLREDLEHVQALAFPVVQKADERNAAKRRRRGRSS